MLSVKLRLLQQFFFPVLFEASDRICAAGGEVSSHPQMRRVERDILVIVYYASQKVFLGSIWRTVAVHVWRVWRLLWIPRCLRVVGACLKGSELNCLAVEVWQNWTSHLSMFPASAEPTS